MYRSSKLTDTELVLDVKFDVYEFNATPEKNTKKYVEKRGSTFGLALLPSIDDKV